jgi:hypothetical protein
MEEKDLRSRVISLENEVKDLRDSLAALVISFDAALKSKEDKHYVYGQHAYSMHP